jgi:hypothetical protein
VLDREGNPTASAPGFFGSDGRSNFDFGAGVQKVPHLRNQYQKIGMFGVAAAFFHNPEGDHTHQGPQVRGFGFLHDGSIDTVFRFVGGIPFLQDSVGNPGGFPVGPTGDLMRRQQEDYMLVFDTNLFPIVGQQTTLTETNSSVVGARIDLLIARADVGDCDLVVKNLGRREEDGYVYIPSTNMFKTNRQSEPQISDALLRSRADDKHAELTYTCVPPGSGFRIAIDRDGDSYLDGDELDEGSDPADAMSTP